MSEPRRSVRIIAEEPPKTSPVTWASILLVLPGLAAGPLQRLAYFRSAGGRTGDILH